MLDYYVVLSVVLAMCRLSGMGIFFGGDAKRSTAADYSESLYMGRTNSMAEGGKTKKLRLTVLVYTCPVCDQDTTFLVDIVESETGYIPRTLDVECPYPGCPNKKVDA